jgi:hypothetical protein
MAVKRKAARRPTSAAKRRGARKGSLRGAMAIATSAGKPARQRIAAMAEAPLAVIENDQAFDSMLNVLRNKDEPIKVRLAALQSLQAASFSVVAFASGRSDYIATLRKVADDPDPELRQRVLGILMREKDGFAQEKLMEGLKKPAKALVPPEKALQLLSYDIHADAYKVAREIVKKPPSDDAKREALRLLAADATAAPIFEKLLRDKKELREIRQISASALHAMNPQTLRKHARKILLDKSDYDDIKATSLTALTQFGDEKIGRDEALLKGVDRLRSAGSAKVKQGARAFLGKYGE